MYLSNPVLSEIKYAGKLPKLPQVIMSLIEACNREDTQTEELIEIISADPGLTARIMDIMASANVNIKEEIRSIETAVVYLGINNIRNLAISMAVMHVFEMPDETPEWNMNKFWYHSFATAVISKKIAEQTGDADPDEAFLAGLMHDIGFLLFLSVFSDKYASILAENKNEQDIITAEKKQFRITRFEAGAWLCTQWNLNPLICDAVLYVNEDETRIISALPLVKIVFTANRLADFRYDENSAKFFLMSGIEEDEAQQLLVNAQKDVNSQADNLGIEIPDFNAEDDSIQKQKEISKQLAEDFLKIKVEQTSLIFGTIENLLGATNIKDILNEVDAGINILFFVQGLFYFLYDDKRHLLTGYSHKEDNRTKIINSIAIPFTNRKSLLIRSLTKKSFISSLNFDKQNEITISDTQIMRLMKAEEMFCFPMFANGKPLGVIVIGVAEKNALDMVHNSGIIEMLAKLSALCLNTISFHTDKKKYVENERVSAASDTTRGIIHEINNPLGIITSYLKILSLKLPDKHPAQKELVVINEEIDRISSLLAQLSDFAAPFTEEFEFIDLNDFFTSILAIVKKTLLLSKGIEAVFIPDTSLSRVKTCKNGLKQILINLIKNSAEAMENGGKIEIITRRIPGSEKIMIDEKRKIPGKLEIIIRDNGPGIPDKIRSRIFEPYNSTKKEGHSGLGLSIVKNIVTRINGTIECETTQNTGTVFKITLPVS